MTSTLKNKLATTTALVVALFGYSRRAYSACVITSGSSYLCSGAATSTQTISANEAAVTTAAGFSVNAAAGNGITVTGDGALSFTDTNASTIIGNTNGLYMKANGDDGGTPGSITINANSNITGTTGNGIAAHKYGTGALTIKAYGNVSGSYNGIYARNNGTDLSITTGVGTTVTGTNQYGINARSQGTGALTIKAYGNVSGAGGIYALNSGTDLSITTGVGTTVTGTDNSGIYANNGGSGALTITADGNVSAGWDGIYARNNGTDLSITTVVGTTVTGTGVDGIAANNGGTGALTIKAYGNVLGSYDGIQARNYGTDLSITTGAGTTVTGTDNSGIYARNQGTGALTITNSGDVIGNVGIDVNGNGGASGSITNASTGTIEGTGGTAISLNGLTAPLPITIYGGHIIGDVIDSAPANGFSPVTIAGNFTSQGNFDVSGFGVSSGATFTFGSGDTITSFNTVSDSGTMAVTAAGSSVTGGLNINTGGILNADANFGITGALANNGTVYITTGNTLTVGSTSTGTGTLDFEVKAGSTTTNGSNGLLASSAAVNLTGSTLMVNVDPTSSLLQNNSRFEVITGVGAATTPVTTATATPVLMTSSGTPAYNFYYTTGAYTGSGYGGPIGGSAADVYVIAVQALTGSAASVYNTLMTSPSFNTIAGILASAPTRTALNNDLQALTPTVDGGAQASALNVVAMTQELENNRLDALREGDATSGVAAGATANGSSMWTEGYGQRANQDMMDGVNGYSANIWGGAVGFDSSALLDKAIVGLAFNYGHSTIDSANANMTTTSLGNYGVTLYGTYDLGQGTFLNGQTGYAYNKITSDRYNANLAGATAQGNTNSDQYSARLDLGHDYGVSSIALPDDWQTDPMTLTPDVSAAYTWLDTQGYTETGAGIADQTVGSNSQSTLDLGIGGTASWKIKDENGNIVKPALHAGYAYSAIDDKIQTTSSFTGDPGVSFITAGASPARSTFDTGAKIIYATAANWDFSATYDFQIKQDYTANTGEVRATVHF